MFSAAVAVKTCGGILSGRRHIIYFATADLFAVVAVWVAFHYVCVGLPGFKEEVCPVSSYLGAP